MKKPVLKLNKTRNALELRRAVSDLLADNEPIRVEFWRKASAVLDGKWDYRHGNQLAALYDVARDYVTLEY